MATENLIELAKLYNKGDKEGVEKIEAYIAKVAYRLSPKLEQNQGSVEFRLSADDALDAGIYANAKPPLVVLSKGLLEFLEDEDEMAWILGHELTHKDIRDIVGDVVTTKLEEAGADVGSDNLLIDAGYNPYAGIKFLRRLQAKIDAAKGGNEDIVGKSLRAILDPHLSGGNRIVTMELGLSNETLFKRGKIDEKTPTPLDPVVFQDLGSARHETFIENWLPRDYISYTPEQKLHRLQLGMKKISRDKGDIGHLRSEQILSELKPIESDGSPEYLAAAEAFVLMAAKNDPYNANYRFDHTYAAVAKTFKPDPTSSKRLKALGPFRDLKEKLEAFSKADPANDLEIGTTAIVAHSELMSRRAWCENDEFTSASVFGSQSATRCSHHSWPIKFERKSKKVKCDRHKKDIGAGVDLIF